MLDSSLRALEGLKDLDALPRGVFFATHSAAGRCNRLVATAVMRRVCRWWALDWQPRSSFSDWNAWFSNVPFFSKVKRVLEGVFCVAWWSLWKLRNRTIFDASPPSRSEIFDDIVVELCTKTNVILGDVISNHQQRRADGQNTEDLLDTLLSLKDDGR
nr:RNA-directed DNA polymerase, eukaryota [Tanacetum cinerariifolium]